LLERSLSRTRGVLRHLLALAACTCLVFAPLEAAGMAIVGVAAAALRPMLVWLLSE